MGQKEDKRLVKLLIGAGFSCGLLTLACFVFFLLIIFESYAAFNKWLEAESYSDFSPRAELDKITSKQLKEYAKNGSFSSELSINAECYDDGTTEVLSSSSSIMNAIKFTSCRDLSAQPSRAERLFIIDSSLNTLKKASRVSCRGVYFGDYQIADDEETMPQLSAQGKPSCPPEYGGDRVEPDYEEYLIREGEVLDPKAYFEQIAEKQIQEFFRDRKISTQANFETDCYKGWTTISEESGIATNFTMAKPCFGLSLQSYINQIVPGKYVNYDYDNQNERWESAHLNLKEITCAGHYSPPQLEELKTVDLSQLALAKAKYNDSYYQSWCPDSLNDELVYPDKRRHRFDLEDEPIPSDLPTPPKRSDSGSPNI